MQEIYVPALGMASDSVYLTEWLKQPGERVAVGDILATIETDKANLDIEATAEGVLGAHRYADGSDVPSGATIAVILAEGETEDDTLAPAAPTTPAPAAPAPAVSAPPAAAVPSPPATVVPTPPALAPAPPAPTSAAAPARSGTAVLAREDRARDPWSGELEPYELSPLARRTATRTAADADAPAPAAPPLPPPVAAPEPRPDSADGATRHREAVAAAVSRSWAEIPHFAVTRELRMDQVIQLHRSLRSLRSDITLTDVVLKAYAVSLIERFGSREIHLGLAVATDRGVAIPVLTDVARADVLQIADLRAAAVERALAHRMSAEDAVVPHSTLSNLGAYGVDAFTGVVPLGQTSILTVGAASPRPVVDDGALAVATTMITTLNVDHRAWDGQHAAEVLRRLAAVTAEPMLLGALH